MKDVKLIFSLYNLTAQIMNHCKLTVVNNDVGHQFLFIFINTVFRSILLKCAIIKKNHCSKLKNHTYRCSSLTQHYDSISGCLHMCISHHPLC